MQESFEGNEDIATHIDDTLKDDREEQQKKRTTKEMFPDPEKGHEIEHGKRNII